MDSSRDLKSLVREFERRLIIHALELHQGHQRRAAASLGVRPTTLNEKMKRLGIRGDLSVVQAVNTPSETS
jgi:DNA-binding NtrC family response regulator